MKYNFAPYATLGVATGLAQALVLLASPVITRLYTQQDFGAFALALGISAFFGSVAAGRLEIAIPIAKSKLDAERRFLLGIVFTIASSGVVLILTVMCLFAGTNKGEFWSSRLLLLISPLCFAIAASQLSSSLNLWHKNYRSYGISKLMQGFSTGLFQIGFGFGGLGSLGLILAQGAAYIVLAAFNLRYALSDSAKELWSSGAQLKLTLAECRQFPTTLVAAAIFNQGSQQLPLIAISQFFGLFETGLFALTYRLCSTPLGLIGQSVSQVYASEIRVQLIDPVTLRTHFLTMVRRLFLLGMLLVAGLVVAVKIFDHIGLFGSGWSGMTTIALCLSPSLLADFIATPVSATLSYLQKQKYQLAWDFGRFIAILLALLTTHYLLLPFHSTILIYSVVWTIAQVVHLKLSFDALSALASDARRSLASKA